MSWKVLLSAICIVGVGCAAEMDDPIAGSTRVDADTREDGIVGGAIDTYHTYVVGVGDAGGPFCTGTVIGKRTVLTAGHCYGSISKIFIGNDVTSGAQAISVAQSIRHPGYDDSTLANDLTILELASDAPVQPAPLLRETMANNSTFVGPNYTFVGYGYDNGKSHTGFGTRRIAFFPIQAVGPASVGGTPGSIDGTQFYYKYPNKNTCNGDSGGPAFIVRNGVERHAGVTSFGDGPCTLDGVQQRTDAPAIADFIQAKLDQFEDNNPCRSDGACNESCNTGAELVDPDCAENHCGADGICALSCASPTDPDCAGGGSGGTGGTGAGSCAHDMCLSGAKLVAACDACAQQICAADAYCCNNTWDSQCVTEVGSICGLTCSVTAACAHDKCATGSKLDASCDPCVTQICSQDSYCCNNRWDSTCRSEVKSICGLSCN